MKNNLFIKQLTKDQKNLRKRILEVSYQRKLSHIGSCLSAVDIIDSVYLLKNKIDRFVLSSGHCAIALYAVLEKKGLLKKSEIYSLNVHPDRDLKKGIEVSTGSLGQGLPIAVGLALASRKIKIYCLISDGESAEGSIWESLRIAKEQNLLNLKVLVNANGFCAYGYVNISLLKKRFEGFGYKVKLINDGHDIKKIISELKADSKVMEILIFKTNSSQFKFLKGVDAHYKIMNDEEYKEAIGELK